MNRREMLTGLSTSVVAGLLTPALTNAQASAPWQISSGELAVEITKPTAKKQKKAITTNRFDDPRPDHEKLIRLSESVIPASWPDAATEGGKPLWYVADKTRPFNITSRAVNEYFALVTTVKDAHCKYTVSVDRFHAVANTESGWEEVIGVTLSLSYGYLCGFLCCYNIDLKKIVLFNKKNEILNVFLPVRSTIEC